MIGYFFHIPILHLVMYCILFVNDVTELMFVVNGVIKRSTCGQYITFETAINHHFKQ